MPPNTISERIMEVDYNDTHNNNDYLYCRKRSIEENEHEDNSREKKKARNYFVMDKAEVSQPAPSSSTDHSSSSLQQNCKYSSTTTSFPVKIGLSEEALSCENHIVDENVMQTPSFPPPHYPSNPAAAAATLEEVAPPYAASHRRLPPETIHNSVPAPHLLDTVCSNPTTSQCPVTSLVTALPAVSAGVFSRFFSPKTRSVFRSSLSFFVNMTIMFGIVAVSVYFPLIMKIPQWL